MSKKGDMMKLNWIEFENLSTGLRSERIKFNPDVTLLVGLSGAGKSQILNVIELSFKLATGRVTDTHNSFRGSLGVSVDNTEYEWTYVVESGSSLFDVETKKNDGLIFVYENLMCNGKNIMTRKGNEILLDKFETFPTPKKDESLISQYSQDKSYKKVFDCFDKLFPLDMDLDIRGAATRDTFLRFKDNISSDIQNNDDFFKYSKFPTPFKLYIAKEFFYDTVYTEIFCLVKELFPEIEDISLVEDIPRNVFLTSIRVCGHDIRQTDISNGMLKTIYCIVELVTMGHNSLVLIDEFENGLGVNCIDILTEVLLNTRNDLQFVITSHHPKIINGISDDKWKVIERDVSDIKNYTTHEYGIIHDPHDAYFNLLNRWEYEGKI